MKEIRPKVQLDLVDDIKGCYPEAAGLTATGVVDWALRKLINIKRDNV